MGAPFKPTDYNYYLKEIWMHYSPEYQSMGRVNLGVVEKHFRSDILPNIDARGYEPDVQAVEFAIKRLGILLDEGWQEDRYSEVMMERYVLALWLGDQLNEWQTAILEHG